MPCRETNVFRTQPEGARSGPGDTDLVVYSLRKCLRLQVKVNPTAPPPRDSPASQFIVVSPLGQELRALAPAVLSRRAVRRFLGYMDSQRQRLLGDGPRRRVPNRPELVARYGYDVKYASHALRLAYQGLEVARDARLTLPMPERERERVLQVKRGDVPAVATSSPRSPACSARSRNCSTPAARHFAPSRTWTLSAGGPSAPTGGTGAGREPMVTG